jgi:dolichol-phosphate mannosyltransferase
MDGDLQHDEQLLSKMLDCLRGGEADLVVASRYIDGGGTGNWGQMRKLMSRLATRLSHFVLPVKMSDPMSGFFMLRRQIIQDAVPDMNGQGYKILLDLVATMSSSYKIVELPYVFRNRTAGDSKLDSMVMWEYIYLLLDKTIGRFVPIRFVSFVAVGLLGAFVHLLILWLAFEIMSLEFWQAQGIAIVVAMTLNFVFNNVLTYRDMRLTGWNWFRGLFMFYLICSVGALANLQVADFVFGLSAPWWFAGLLGGVIGSVWNFAVNTTFTWKRSRKTEA